MIEIITAVSSISDHIKLFSFYFIGFLIFILTVQGVRVRAAC